MTASAFQSKLNRRRFISIAAAASAGAAMPAWAVPRQMQTFSWRGIALGAEASLTLQHDNEAQANDAIAACLAEVARLEAIFSLYQHDSALSRLNRDGSIDDAPLDLQQLLARSLRLAELSAGGFDPTVQPLWRVYAQHFSNGDAVDGPASERIEEALSLVSWRRVAMSGATIKFEKPGMGLTLNGIAQGYITDKVSDVLTARGFEHVLVNMGEQRALGSKWDGNSWRVGISDPAQRERAVIEIPIMRGAIATSGGYGCSFDNAGNFTHILDPRTGRSARHFASITVTAASATDADGLSTALAVDGSNLLKRVMGDGIRVFAVPFDGTHGYWLA